MFKAVTYSGRLENWYTGLGTQTLTPKKTLFKFSFSVAFEQKVR